MEKTEATYMDVDSLIPHANNPRLNDNAVDAVAASIKELGFKVPIVVDGENVIINGHTRLKAAHKLGLKQAPVIVADDLTPEQAKAFRLADNKTGELAEDVYYLCGVSSPYKRENNFHLAFRRKEGSSIKYSSNGATARIEDAERSPIDAKHNNPTDVRYRTKSYCTCRNWQLANCFETHLKRGA